MTALTWDQAGQRRFETGVERGVLYLPDSSAVAWNGLTGIEENSTSELKSYYLDGVKYLDYVVPSDFSATLKAFTYPDEFEELLGVHEHSPGFFVHDQRAKSFGLTYRTRIGNDVEGVDLGYRLHILYNVKAIQTTTAFGTINDSVTPTEFSWTLSAVPNTLIEHRPTAHLSFDSMRMDPTVLAEIEGFLYGTEDTDPYLPLFSDLFNLAAATGIITITDHGDGTWSAEGPAESVYLTDSTTFEIDHVDATYSDPDTYDVSTTIPE
ncbi:MAG TPA: hypothetical protein VN843_28795 [Anaerolineales bacterium]|nr:hypothetical protein [Anaerolineales bacterium]